MTSLTRLALGAATAAVMSSMSVMPAAQASLPSQGSFTNSEGETNGCAGHLEFRLNTLNPTTYLNYNMVLTCPASADIWYGQNFGSLHVVNPDGTWTTIQAQDSYSWKSDTVVDQGDIGWSTMQPCPSAGAPQTYVARVTIILKTVRVQDDPFKLRLQAKYTC